MDLDSDLHESPASPDLSGSQSNVDVKLTEKKKTKKRKKGKSKNNSSQSCVEADICLHGNEEKKQKVLSQAAEKGNGESEIQDKADNCNSVVADADAKLLAKESVLEVVKMDIEQSINENSSNPKETSVSVKNGSPVNNHDEDLKVHDLSNKSQSIKTYSRKKLNDVNCKRNLECPSAENSNKEPIIQDHNNDGSHEVSDGPLRDVLMEGEKEHLTNQNKVEAEEMELIADYSSEKSSMTTSSIVDIPVTQHEERNARQKGHAELTRNDLCCLTDISDLSLSSGNSEISQCSVDRTIISNSKNKLLILDVNGLLADCVSDVPNGYYQPEPDFWVRRRKGDMVKYQFSSYHTIHILSWLNLTDFTCAFCSV